MRSAGRDPGIRGIYTSSCAASSNAEAYRPILSQMLRQQLSREASPKHHIQEALVLRILPIWKLSPWDVESCSWILFSRCISNIKAIATSRIPEHPALAPTFQNAEQAEHTGSNKRRVTEECFAQEDSKKSRIDVVSPGEGHAFRTQETRQAQGGLQGKPLEATGTQTSRQQDLAAPLGRKWLLF